MTLSVLERPRDAMRTGSPPALSAVAPIVPVRDVRASLRFYRDRLGFTVERMNPDMSAALVVGDAARFMLLRVGEKRALQSTREHLSAYVWTEDADALFDHLAPALADLPDWRLRAPFTQPWGAREFHLRDPDGFLLLFASEPAAARALHETSAAH